MSCSGEVQGGEGERVNGEVEKVEVEAMSTLIHISQFVLPHSGLQEVHTSGLVLNNNNTNCSSTC